MAKKSKHVGAPLPELFSAAESEAMNRETSWLQSIRNMRGCRVCPLSTSAGCSGPMPGQGSYQRPWIAFVLEAPSPGDNASGIVLDPATPSGMIFDRLLKRIGMTRANVLLMYGVSCVIPHSAPPDSYVLEACAPHVKTQLEIAHPHTVVACGWAATSALLGHSRELDEQVDAWRRCMGTQDWQYWRGAGGMSLPWRPIHHPSTMAASARSRGESINSLLPVLERLEKSTQGAYVKPADVVYENLPDPLSAVLH